MPDHDRAALDRRTAYELLCHLAASAELCVVEPVHYGTFRLLDALSRLARALLEAGLEDPWLDELLAEVDENKTLMMSDLESYYAFLPKVSLRLAERLREIALDAPDKEARP